MLKKITVNILLSFLLTFLSCFLSLNFFNTKLSISPATNYYHTESLYNEKFDKEDNTKIILKYKTKIWKYNTKDFIESSKQFDINYELNKNKLNNNKAEKIKLINKLKQLKINNEIIIDSIFPKISKKIKLIEKNIKKHPQNAYFKYNNKLKIINEINGININYDLLYELILNNYIEKDVIEIDIPITTIYPEIRRQDLEKVSNLRASFSTHFTQSTLDRKHNIYQALKKINGIKIGAGEKFSFNNTVGRRTKENGFRIAKIISNGEFVDGFGGGVCQVSTTLYNSALLAGLKIDKSSKHSEKVSYVTSGFDAMVNFGSSDLVFTNNTNNDIYIFTSYTDTTMTINIYGESKNGVRYKLVNEISNEIEHGEEEVIIDHEKKYIDKVQFTDESFYLKKARNGYTVKSFRETYLNGKLQKRELLRTDKYKPQNAVKIVGSIEKDLSIYS